MINTYIAPVTK